MEIYLDHAATTPPDPLVRQAVADAMERFFANASSVHAVGRRARRAVEEARESVAHAIGAKSREIIFTSGATEADNQALIGAMELRPDGRLVTSPLEHAAVRSTARRLERQGRVVSWVAPDGAGRIDPQRVNDLLGDDVALVALMLVNNETGIRTDIAAVAEAAHAVGAAVFCDAVQAFGFEPVDVGELGVDMLAISGHKAYGPKGVGALWVREGLELPPLLSGGEQERGSRPGTLDVPAIVGFGVAAELARERLPEHAEEVRRLRDLFESEVLDEPGLVIHGRGCERGVKHSSVRVEGVDGEGLLMSLDSLGVYASAGSACSAGSLEPSHVLLGMGLTREQAKATVRFTFGRGLALEEVRDAAARFREAVRRCRSLTI